METVKQIIQSARAAAPAATSLTSEERRYSSVELVQAIWRAYKRIVQADGETATQYTEQLNVAVPIAGCWLADLLNKRPGASNWLHIQGSLGTGKTTLARAVAQVIRVESGMDYKVRELTAINVARYARQEEYQYLFERALNDTDVVSIDDIGEEPAEVMSFGNVITPIKDVYSSRYSRDLPTIFTTNLNVEDITKRYGERVTDRIREKAYIITLTGESWRKINKQNNKQ